MIPERIYNQIIYNLLWPSLKYPHFTAPIESIEDWKGVIDILREWAPILPDDFLVSFIGNQILAPRIHSLFLLNTEDAVDDEYMALIANVWGFLIELKFKEVLQVLETDLITWLNNRILKVRPKKFIQLLQELTNLFANINCESAWIKRCEKLLQRDLIIDPSDQDLIPIECILSLNRSNFIKSSKLSHILTINLIPKLKKCVQKWMKSESVDYEEVAEWYLAWKDIFPENLLLQNDEELMNGFGEILTIINENLD